MALRLRDIAPNFTAQTTEGEVDFHQWLGESYRTKGDSTNEYD